MSKTLPPPAVYGINSAQRVLEQGALVVRLEDYEQLQARFKDLAGVETELRNALELAASRKARIKELENIVEDYRERVRSWTSKALHENAEKRRLEAENAELRAEVYCNQMCVRFWPGHHSNCRLLATRLNRIKQQTDDEGKRDD